ncbi:MAG: hypothetical protein M3Y08_08465, partial [Fibrobacterota bacterium]|nr:hypothetical protein [Fibrobacterota bacterium]
IGLAFNAFINAMQPLIMREFSIAFSEKNVPKAAEVFRKLIPAAYTLTAFFLCFASVNSEAIVRAVGGKSFGDAAAVFAIMALLPVIQNYSMLSGSVLYASNKTRLIRNIGIVMVPLGIAATYFLIAPGSLGGLGQGAVGLAAKTVALEFIGNNIILFYNSRILSLKFHRYFLHQIYVVVLFLAVAFTCKWAFGHLALAGPYDWLWRTVMGGIIYVILCLGLIYSAPALFGIDKRQILDLLGKQLARFRKS